MQVQEPKGLEAFDAKLAGVHMRGQWKSEELLLKATDGPKPAGVPALWTWAQVTGLLEEAGRVMPQSLQARRSLVFQNPALPRGTTHTLNMGVQMIMPGEIAWAHRHSISALRFVIKGHPKLSTIVDGQRCVMEDFDLVLTPNWSWHDHHNEADQPVYWLDVLDVGVVLGLNQAFYQPGTNRDQPVAAWQYPGLRPHYPWSEVSAGLAGAPLQPQAGRVHQYLNADGGPTMPTLACQVQALPAGFRTTELRRTSSAVYFVIAGDGVTRVGGQEMRWSKHDCFAVPNWARHSHEAFSNGDALLFSVHDTPVLHALGLYREDIAA